MLFLRLLNKDLEFTGFCMFSVRKFLLKIFPIGVILFSLLLIISHVASSNLENITYSVVDFGDNSESSKEKTPENQLKEHKFNNSQLITFEGLYLCECSKYGQFNFGNSLEVFLEIVTPPPEA